MEISEACLNYLNSIVYTEETRLRVILSGFFETICGVNGLEIWSSIFDHGEQELFTNVILAGAASGIERDTSYILDRDQVLQRSEARTLVEFSVPLTGACGQLPLPRFLIVFDCNSFSEPESSIITATAAKISSDFFRASVRRMYEELFAIAQQSKDLTSFLHKTIRTIILREFRFQYVSVFYYENKTDSLVLGSTTGLTGANSGNLKRSDVRYFTDGSSYTARSFQSGEEICENEFRSRPVKENRISDTNGLIHSRVYVPLRRWDYAPSNEDLNVVGMIRASNANSDNNFHPITTMQRARLRVLSGAMSVFTERYIRTLSVLHDQERATHGYSTDLSAIRHAAQNIERWLSRVTPDLSHNPEGATALQEVLYRSRDILAVQDNMACQLLTVMHHSGGSRINTRMSDSTLCNLPYTDVFMRLASAKRGMSECFGRRELIITYNGKNRADETFIRIPPLKISVGSFYLIIRNLAENSIKYSDKHVQPVIDISWSQSSSVVRFRLKDNGVGILRKEQHLLGREGFRGRRAQELQLRGNGLGLAVSREAAESAHGSLHYEFTGDDDTGSVFIVTVPVQ